MRLVLALGLIAHHHYHPRRSTPLFLSSSSSSSSLLSEETTPWSKFQFNDIGRCLRPRYFVDIAAAAANDTDADDDDDAADDGWFELQNVRGDGDCVFLAITRAAVAATSSSTTTTSCSNNRTSVGGGRMADRTTTVEEDANAMDMVRHMVAQVLEDGRACLRISPETTVSASALLQQAAHERNCSKRHYLHQLRTPGRYGGLYGGTWEGRNERMNTKENLSVMLGA
jgi:hypothetical protein